jgi:hypothetical protein
MLRSTMHYEQSHRWRTTPCTIAEIVPISAWEWAPTLFGGSFTWYLHKAAAAASGLHARHQSKICLVRATAGEVCLVGSAWWDLPCA